MSLIDQIWKCCIEKHEAVAKATFGILQDLVRYLPVSILEIIWTKVRSLENDEIDDMKVHFLK
jgi:hypothetical protein